MNKQVKKTNRTDSAFSLIEVIFSMFILTISALALTKGIIFAQYTAENNLYEATALTVAVSTIEQMKGASIDLIQNPPVISGQKTFEMVIENGSARDLQLGRENTIDIPLITKEDGTIQKSLPLKITPSITSMTSGSGYWLDVEYEYTHPRNRRTYTQTIRNVRSTVPTL